MRATGDGAVEILGSGSGFNYFTAFKLIYIFFTKYDCGKNCQLGDAR